MGGQACVFYGAAQVSKDIDFLLLAEPENFARLQAALGKLQADRIAVPPFDPAALARGHAVHFRCSATGVEGLRVDIMTRLRAMPEFASLWERRTTLVDDEDIEYHLLCIPDLVHAKKTQKCGLSRRVTVSIGSRCGVNSRSFAVTTAAASRRRSWATPVTMTGHEPTRGSGRHSATAGFLSRASVCRPRYP